MDDEVHQKCNITKNNTERTLSRDYMIGLTDTSCTSVNTNGTTGSATVRTREFLERLLREN